MALLHEEMLPISYSNTESLNCADSQFVINELINHNSLVSCEESSPVSYKDESMHNSPVQKKSVNIVTEDLSKQIEVDQDLSNASVQHAMKQVPSDSSDEDIFMKRRPSRKTLYGSDEDQSNTELNFKNNNQSDSDEAEEPKTIKRKKRHIIQKSDSDSDSGEENKTLFKSTQGKSSFSGNDSRLTDHYHTNNNNGNSSNSDCESVSLDNIKAMYRNPQRSDKKQKRMSRGQRTKTGSAHKSAGVPVRKRNNSESDESSPELQDHSSQENNKSYSEVKAKKSVPHEKPRKSKPISHKVIEAERQKIHSESQRQLRNQRIELPYCHVKPRTLDELLEKRKSLPKLSSTSIKMSSAELEKWVEREKQLQVLYRSESSDSEKENDSLKISSQQIKHEEAKLNLEEVGSNPVAGEAEPNSPPLRTITNLASGSVESLPINETISVANEEDEPCSDASNEVTSSHISNPSNIDLLTVVDHSLSNTTDRCDEREVASAHSSGDSVPLGVEHGVDSNQGIVGHVLTEIKSTTEPHINDNISFENTSVESVLADSNIDVNGINSLTSANVEMENEDKLQSDVCNSNIRPSSCWGLEKVNDSKSQDNHSLEEENSLNERLKRLRETLSDDDLCEDDFILRISDESDDDTEVKNKANNKKSDRLESTSKCTEETTSFGVLITKKELPTDKTIDDCGIDKAGTHKEPELATEEYSSKRLALLRQKGLVSVNNICPRLSGGPEDVIDLEDSPGENTEKDGVMSLMERFLRHSAKPKPAKQRLVDFSVVSAEKGENGLEEVKKEVVTILLDEDEEKKEEEKVPGSKYRRLQECLQHQITEQRKAEWLRKTQELNKPKDSSSDEDASDCNLLDDEEEMTVSESGEEDEEEIEDVPIVEKKRRKGAFMDDEAEVSEDEGMELSSNDTGDEAEETAIDKKQNQEFPENVEDDDDEDEAEGDADVSSSDEEDDNHSLKQRKKKRTRKQSKTDDDDASDDNDEVKDQDNISENKNVEGTPTNNLRKPFRRLLNFPLSDTDEETSDAGLDKGNEQDLSISVASTYSDTPLPAGQVVRRIEPEPSPTPQGRLFDFLSPIAVDSTKSPFGTPTSSTNTQSNLQKSFSKQLFFDAEDIPSTQEYMDVLMGNTKTKEDQDGANLNLSTLISSNKDDEIIPSQNMDDDLIGLMSGTFGSQMPVLEGSQYKSAFIQTQILTGGQNKKPSLGLSTQSQKSVPKAEIAHSQLVVSQAVGRELSTDTSQTEHGQELAVELYKRGEPAKIGTMRLVSSDEEDILISDKPEDFPKKRTKKKLKFSDDEDNLDDKADSNSSSEEDELVAEENDPYQELVEYDSEENEVVYHPGKGHKNMARTKDFFEAEAELSESEWDSADEDERDLDRLEWEEGDEENLDTDAMKEQLDKIHMRQILDEDQRDVRLLKEMLFEDGDLHSEGGGRERKFRWKNSGDGFGMDSTQNDSEDGGVDEGDEEEEEKWRKARHERETFLREHREKTQVDDTSVERVFCEEEESQLLVLGKKAIKRLRSMNSHEQTIIERKKITVVRSASEPVLSPDAKRPFNMLNKRGSFLARGEMALARIATLTRDASDNVVLATNSNARSCVFATISPKDEPVKDLADKKISKRKSMSVTPSLVKKPKIVDGKAKQRRLFEHLSLL